MRFLIHTPYMIVYTGGAHKNVKTAMSVSVYTGAKEGGAEGNGNNL